MEKIDQLFKAKLSDHKVEVSPQVWTSLEQKLTKKNKGITWIRVAAGLALITGASYSILLLNQEPEIIDQPIAKEIQNQPIESLPQLAPLEKTKSKVNVTAINQKEEKTTPIINTTETNQPIAQIELQESKFEQQTALLNPEIIINTPILPEQNEVGETELKERPMVLVYTLARIEKPAIAQDQKNGFEKALTIAKEIKNSETDVVGNIRQFKDELFAMQFLKKSTNEKNNN
ncbi:MAG: hypothetical protein HC811_06480 [Flammeovirgaceae bacterium]|nr:hypothetical protein [Flammeovirgaceae bacterium]